MVRFTSLLYRVPTIKFRKGGFPEAGAVSQGPAAAGTQSGAAAPVQSSAPMSTHAINDFELPIKYQRRPMSQEEIDHINGGGISVDNSTRDENSKSEPTIVIKLPNRVTIHEVKGNDIKYHNIVIKRTRKKK